MNILFFVVLIFFGIWEATTEIVLNEGIDDPIAWVIYNREFTLDGSSQTVDFPPQGFVVDDFRITKVKISSDRPNGLKAKLKEGGRGTKSAKVELEGKSGTKFRFVISIVFEGQCSQTTTIDDWNRIVSADKV